jgi:hypothetical protein
MVVKEQLKAEIDHLDDRYLDLALRIIRQFPHSPDKQKARHQGQKAADILQDIADHGGLGISDPVAWQREIRQDRVLPFRSD